MNMRLKIFLTIVVSTTLLPPRGAAQSPREKLLVDATWLQKHVNDKDLVLLHVGDKAEYDREHIPGARFIGMRDLAAPQQDMAHGAAMDHTKNLILEMPAPEAARAKLESLGISDKSRIIVYYGNDWVSPSTRIVLDLDWIGLGDRTSLLDGGMRAWKRAGGTVTADLPATRPGKLSAKPVKDIIVTRAWLLANLKNPKYAIIDGRTRNFYDGVAEGARPGHIAGAGSFPFNTTTTDSLFWKSPKELEAQFKAAGYEPGDTIIGYCHIGQQATAMLFAARTLGYKVKLYDGSYTEWEAYADSPIEKTAPAGTR